MGVDPIGRRSSYVSQHPPRGGFVNMGCQNLKSGSDHHLTWSDPLGLCVYKKVGKWSVKYMVIYEPLKNKNQISTFHNIPNCKEN